MPLEHRNHYGFNTAARTAILKHIHALGRSWLSWRCDHLAYSGYKQCSISRFVKKSIVQSAMTLSRFNYCGYMVHLIFLYSLTNMSKENFKEAFYESGDFFFLTRDCISPAKLDYLSLISINGSSVPCPSLYNPMAD